MIGANPLLVTPKPDGSVSGVAVDLGQFIAEKLGVAFEPVIYATAEMYTQSFGKGEWDMAIGARTPAAAEKFDFSPDIMLVDSMYVAAPGRAFADASHVDRPGVKVGVVQNGALEQLLSRTLKSAELVRVPGTVESAIETLRSGKADVYASNAQFVQAIADGLPGVQIIPGALNTVGIAVVLPKGRSSAAQGTLADIVNEAKGTGIMQKAIEALGLRGVRVAPH